MLKATLRLGSGWVVETSELESESPMTSFLSQNLYESSRSQEQKLVVTQIMEGMKLCVLAKVDEERMWKCLVSAKGQEGREGPTLSPQLDSCWSLQLAFMSPTEN